MRRLWIPCCLLLSLLLAPCFALAQSNYRECESQWTDIARATQTIVIPADSYTAAQMPGLSVLEDGTVYTAGSGYVEYTVTVPQTALYTLSLRYFPADGSGADIQRALYINGQLPFREAGELAFSRAWNDANRDYKQIKGNQPFPSQVETPVWLVASCRDSIGYVIEPFLFLLQAGDNTLRLESLRESMILSSLTLAPEQALLPYADYIASHIAGGAAYADIAPIKIQAEDASLKSSPSFYPINDRTSALTEPYHPSNITLNAIGGAAWNEPGEWLAWDFDVPAAGLYRVALRFKQSDLRGLYATRTLRVNDRIPFAEAADLRFYYSSDFQFSCLSRNRLDPTKDEATEEFWLYLDAGANRLTLEVSLGALGDILLDLEATIAGLNSLYREIVSITGTAPDTYRDYQLYARIPHLRTALVARRAELDDILARLTALTGAGSERTAGITRLMVVMDEFLRKDDAVVKKLSAFKECITAMGKATLDLKDQPLKLDYLMLLGKQTPDVRADGNIFQKCWHALRAFVGSFFNDYNVVASDMDEAEQTVDVWLSTGRDQFEVIRRLINESFEAQTGVRVNLKLINADVLLPSTFTGNGPDVAIQIGNSAPVNFAFRGAAYDLSQFDDFEDVRAGFLPAAMASFYYRDGCYALPDQMSFPVLYYRHDILDALGLAVPQTWDDLIAMIPYLQRNNMEIYLDFAPVATLGAAISIGNSKAVNTVFLSLLYQLGGDVYLEDGTASAFGSEAANLAFKQWTEFYTKHGFPQEIDFVTRFRIGEVPLGIVDLSTYTRLAVSAPEIRGDWSVAPVPGTRREDGTLLRDVPCVTGAAMMLSGSVTKKGNADAAWAFLKWWTGADTQTKYAREMEAVLGPAGRYPVANLEAFASIAWAPAVKAALEEMLPNLHGIPQVPGGYITGRYLDNAFITVITDYANPADLLYEYTELINEEITNKRREFGLEE